MAGININNFCIVDWSFPNALFPLMLDFQNLKLTSLGGKGHL
jgi:hypothetical protein